MATISGPPCLPPHPMHNRGHRPPPNTSLLIFFLNYFFSGDFQLPQEPQNKSTPPSTTLHPSSTGQEYSQGDRYVQGELEHETGSNKRRPIFFFGCHSSRSRLTTTFLQAIAVAMPPCYSQKTSRTTDQPPQLMRSETHPTSGPPVATAASPETAPSLLSLSKTLARRARPDSTLCTGSSSPPPKGTSSGSRLAM